MSAAIEDYLSQHGVPFDIIENQTVICESSHPNTVTVRAVVFRDALGLLMAILPDDHLLDYDTLCHLLGRELKPLDDDELINLYSEYKPDLIPPLPDVFGLSAVVSVALDKENDIYFMPGVADKLVKVSMSGRKNSLWNKAQYLDFSEPFSVLLPDQEENRKEDFVLARMKKRVDETYELPTMPHIASRLLTLRVSGKATAVELSAVVENDPSLVAQIICWARSPYYGYTGKIESVEDAIIRVLGFDLVMNLALGLSVGHSLHVPIEGRLGLRNYWLESIYSAVTVDALAHRMKWTEKPMFGIAYLCGMLHNFGRLLLGHIFVPQYKKLELYVLANPHVPISVVEKKVIGVGHDMIAGWALKNWRMPPEVISSAISHHENEYRGEHAVYVNLVNLACRILKQHGLSDADSARIPDDLLEFLGLTINDISEVEQQVFSHQDKMLLLSRQMLGE